MFEFGPMVALMVSHQMGYLESESVYFVPWRAD